MFKTTVTHMSDLDLLRLLVPRGARQLLANHTLADLFLSPEPSQTANHVAEATPTNPRQSLRLQAARELMSRALVQAMQTKVTMTSPTTVKDYLKLHLAKLEYEVFVVMYLNSQHQLISCEQLFRGSLSQTAVYPREIVKQALACNAAAVILAHNHPSGVPEPSTADEMLTRQVVKALELVDVNVLDHFIVAGTHQPVSLRERGRVF